MFTMVISIFFSSSFDCRSLYISLSFHVSLSIYIIDIYILPLPSSHQYFIATPINPQYPLTHPPTNYQKGSNMNHLDKALGLTSESKTFRI